MNRFFGNTWVRRLGLYVALPVALIYGAIQVMYPTCTFRYKLTAEVMTPDGLKTGSSVIEVSYSSVHPLPNPGRWRADTVLGEALYVDLGSGKNLFILLGRDKWGRIPSRTPGPENGFDGIAGGNDAIYEQQLAEGSLNVAWLPIEVFKVGRMPGNERAMQARANSYLGEGSVDVDFKNLPLLGTFADINKPETFNIVLPTDATKALGPGFALRRVTMQMVNEEPDVSKVKSVLPWLETLRSGLREPPDRMVPDMRASIGQRYFIALGYELGI